MHETASVPYLSDQGHPLLMELKSGWNAMNIFAAAMHFYLGNIAVDIRRPDQGGRNGLGAQ